MPPTIPMPPTILPHPNCPQKKPALAVSPAAAGESLASATASEHRPPPPAARPLVTLLSCYMTGSTEGRNLGTPGYSHDFVARAYAPLLARHGEVRVVPDAQADLDGMVDAVLAEGKLPLHFSILPLQDVVLARRAVNVAVPAWEYPDVPNHAFDGNAQNDWPQTADRCDMVLVSGPFTHEALRRGGASGAIRMVQVPVEDAYFAIPLWQPGQTRTLDCRAFVFPQTRPTVATNRPLRRTAAISAGLRQLKSRRIAARTRGGRPTIRLPYESVSQVKLSGVVYTSIFNPDDGRKNWPDLINGFLLALGDREDATLVLKLITSRAASVDHVIRHIFNRGIEFRCRLVVICDFLDEEQLHQLTEATTFYLQASRAEGNCLPLMNHLAAGRPRLAARKTSAAADNLGTDCLDFVAGSDQGQLRHGHGRSRRLCGTGPLEPAAHAVVGRP